jgi:L-histidine N-alpha-methyltransferase
MPVLQIEVHLDPNHRAEALRADALLGLTRTPKELPPKWHYDERGSELFTAITRLPEYYLTRCERAILTERASEIAESTRADTLIELGAGTSEKTRLLLDALADAGSLRRFVALDVSEDALRASAQQLATEYSTVDIVAVVGDIDQHLARLPTGGRRVVAFLGSSIGNFPPSNRADFLGDLRAALAPGEWFLLGTDLVKDVARLEAAYDDASGVTAQFSTNVLRVLNRELRANFDVARFRHVARWNADEEWIEIGLVSLVDQVVQVAALDLDVQFAAGEEMRTEISAKFRREGLERELREAGFDLAAAWTDPGGDFLLSLSVAS